MISRTKMPSSSKRTLEKKTYAFTQHTHALFTVLLSNRPRRVQVQRLLHRMLACEHHQMCDDCGNAKHTHTPIFTNGKVKWLYVWLLLDKRYFDSKKKHETIN